MNAITLDIEAHAMVGADDVVILELSCRQWHGTVRAAVLHGHHLAIGTAKQHDASAQQGTGQQMRSQLVRKSGYVPIVKNEWRVSVSHSG
jgi:hypothetical protein